LCMAQFDKRDCIKIKPMTRIGQIFTDFSIHTIPVCF
jgi:hypothetical protein